MEAFVATYQFFEISFPLGYLVVSVAFVMTVQYSMLFVAQWFAAVLAKQYEKHLRTRAFDGALGAEVGYYDEAGSDDILNAIITETQYSALIIQKGVKMLKMLFLVLMYVIVMFYITLSMTVIAMGLLGGVTVLLRVVIEPAVTVGSRVADANERVPETVQMCSNRLWRTRLHRDCIICRND